jgi:hypothetical protein
VFQVFDLCNENPKQHIHSSFLVFGHALQSNFEQRLAASCYKALQVYL